MVHPIPERFGSTEDWGRSLLGAVALAVQTHPRLYDHARLDRLFGRDPAEGARVFDGATGVLCGRYGLDLSTVVSRARAFEAKPVGDRVGVSALDEIEDRTGVPPARFEVARRAFWTALGDACEREGVARGWADAAIATGDHDHVMLERVRRAADADVPLGGPWLRPGPRSRCRAHVGRGSAVRRRRALGGGRRRGPAPVQRRRDQSRG